jgi:hypothetical protein
MYFWAEVVQTTVFLLNRSPTKGVDGETPYEAWSRKKPHVTNFNGFGCLAYAHISGNIEINWKQKVGSGYLLDTTWHQLLTSIMI